MSQLLRYQKGFSWEILFMSANQVRPAVIELSDGKPYSPEFEDIYATRSGAYGQACTVFLSEGEVARRWQGKERFTVLENGFGLGTNFLATLKAWRNDPKRSAHLEYVALECFPVSRSQIEQYAAVELADWWVPICLI